MLNTKTPKRTSYMLSATLILISVFTVSAIGLVYGAEEAEEPEIVFSEFQFVVIGIGGFAGLVTAYNGYVKNKRQQGEKFVFDRTKFLDRLFMAVIWSIPLAIAESANIVVLDLFGAWLIFGTALGMAELTMEIRARRGT